MAKWLALSLILEIGNQSPLAAQKNIYFISRVVGNSLSMKSKAVGLSIKI